MSANINEILDDLAVEFEEQIKRRRSVILDLFQELLGHFEGWDFIRGKLLKFTGDSGLLGDFAEIVERAKRRANGGRNEDC